MTFYRPQLRADNARNVDDGNRFIKAIGGIENGPLPCTASHW